MDFLVLLRIGEVMGDRRVGLKSLILDLNLWVEKIKRNYKGNQKNIVVWITGWAQDENSQFHYHELRGIQILKEKKTTFYTSLDI